MKGKIVKKICIVIVTIILLLGSYNVVNALTESELEQKRIELNLKIEEAGKDIEAIEVELTQNLEAINALDEEIFLYEEQIDTISQNLSKIETQIRQAETILTEIEARYEYQSGLLEKRLLYAYKSGKTRYLDVLLSSTDIMDFISKYHFVSEMIRYDEILLESIANQRNKIQEVNRQLENAKTNLKNNNDKQKKLAISL